MKNAKKFRLTYEFHKTLILRGQIAKAYLPVCLSEQDFMMPEAITDVYKIGTRRILNFAEYGQVHAIESKDGQLMICRKSIMERFGFQI